MFKDLSILSQARDMARHAAHRQELTAKNIANADTPGFKAQDVTAFKATIDNNPMPLRTRSGQEPSFQQTPSWRVIEVPGHTDPNGNSVSLETEVLRSVEAERSHSRAVSIYQTSLDILRSSLGKR